MAPSTGLLLLGVVTGVARADVLARAIGLSGGLLGGHVETCTLVRVDANGTQGFEAGTMPLPTMRVDGSGGKALLPMWLKKHVGCALAVVEGGVDEVEGAVDLVRPVARKLVLVVGPTQQIDAEALPTDAQVVWFTAVSSGQAYLSLKCPTVTTAPWSVAENINLWSEVRGRFALPGPLLCNNPMFGQRLKMLHSGGPWHVVVSPETGLPVGGRLFRLYRLLSEAFEFELAVEQGPQPFFKPESGTWGGVYGRVINGSGFGYMGAWAYGFDQMDLSAPYDDSEAVFASRRPLPVDTYDNLMKPLSPGVWAAYCFVLAALGAAFLLAHSAYSANSETRHLIKAERSKANFVLFTFAKVTEPEALPWFPRWSAGRFLVMQWSVLSTFLTMFYSSNLLAHLTMRELERPIDTLQDVVDNGGTPYIYTTASWFSEAYFEATGQLGSPAHQVAQLAEKTGGFYSIDETGGGLPKRAPKDVLENRAVFLTQRNVLPFSYWSVNISRQDLHATRESAHSLHECLVFRKHSPATPHVDWAIRRAVEAGLPDKFLTELLSAKEVEDLRGPFTPPAPLGLRSFYLALIAFAVGVVISAVVFCICEASTALF